MDDMVFNRHYIVVDEQGRITDGWSDGPHPGRDTTAAIPLTEQGGYQFRLFPGGVENPMLTDVDGIPLYQWDGLTVTRRSEEAMDADRAALPTHVVAPTESERLAALEAAMLAIMSGGVVDV